MLGDVLRGHSQLRPAKVAVETLDGRSVTFAQLNSRVNSLVASVSTVGISKGARVAILARNMPEYLEVFGLAKAGIVVVPLNWRLTSAEIAKLRAVKRLLRPKKRRNSMSFFKLRVETRSTSSRSFVKLPRLV